MLQKKKQVQKFFNATLKVKLKFQLIFDIKEVTVHKGINK